jgi:putative copper export protein
MMTGDREPPQGSDPAARAEPPPTPSARGGSAAKASQADAEGPSAGVVIVAALAAFSLLGFAGLLWHCGSLPLMDEPRVGRTVRVLAGLALGFGFVDLASWTLRVVPDGAGLPAYAAALGSATGIVGSASLALIAVAIALLSRRPRMAAGLALAAVLIGAAAGHPAVFSPWLTIPANALHLGAATIWLGGLLLLASIPDRPSIAAAGWTLPETVRSVSASALLAVILIAASGMIQSVRFVGEIGALTSTGYGRGVLAKSAGLLVLVGFGAFHRLRVLPRLETDGGRRLRRTVLAEMIVMLVVVLVAVWLARVPPPIEH